MAEAPAAELEGRVLLLAPTRRDAAAAGGLFASVGIALTPCRDLDEVCAEMERGAAVAILPDEAILDDKGGGLVRFMEDQPAWSDFPLIVLTAPNRSMAALRELESIGHMTLVRRPTEIHSLASTVRTALRDRRRQYATRAALAEREEQARALRESDRQKDEFLAMLAHELRNPLAAIGNAVTLTTRGGHAEHLEWAMGVMARQIRHLTHLIDDLLDVSRISRGKIQLRRAVLDLTPILDSATATARALIEERKHGLDVEIDRGALWADVDPTRLEQVVVNLLNNAAKYSEDSGHIRLSARNEGGEIVISVRDRGVGIAPEKLPQMFELFAQGDRSLARSEGGLGIGLTVVKKLVEMHGGSIEARSDGPGRGSEFTLRLPRAERPAEPTPEESPRASGPESPARVLVIDDSVDTARGMARLLKLLGHDVAVAHSGPEGIELAKSHRPRFVLLDIGLPGMDGYEVASRLRREESSKDAVIIAVSGYGQEEDRRRSKEAGFDHHLIKPLDHDALLSLLATGADHRG